MKTYPSISGYMGQCLKEMPNAYVFDKLDGSNLRFEWSKKSGWYKFGTRHCLINQDDENFGGAIPIFLNKYGDELHSIFKRQNYESVIVFGEYWGKHSFAGWHDPNDTMDVTIFDVAPFKKGILGPKQFLDLVGHLDISTFLGIADYDLEFAQKVRADQIEGVTFEGVVVKAGEGHHLKMAKAKTQKWIDAVKARYGDEADKIILS